MGRSQLRFILSGQYWGGESSSRLQKEGFRTVAMAGSGCVGKAKAHLELKVERDIEDNKAIFCHWMGSERISKENAEQDRLSDSAHR